MAKNLGINSFSGVMSHGFSSSFDCWKLGRDLLEIHKKVASNYPYDIGGITSLRWPGRQGCFVFSDPK